MNKEKPKLNTPEASPLATHESIEKHHERLRRNLEKAESEHATKKESFEHVQREAMERADSLKHASKKEVPPAEKRNKLFSKQQREASFNRQMNAIRAEMSPSEKRLSKFIHNRTIENVSESLGATIARPNALLAGSISAFVLVTLLYLITKHYGYHLSGFETLGAFILGWVLGITYDYIKLLVSGRR